VEAVTEKETPFPATKLPRVGPKIQALLKESGFDSLEKLAAASLEDLTQIKGIGVKTAVKILKAAQKLAKGK
jgi:DNA polymerase/3'-5' exonuclease PolX